MTRIVEVLLDETHALTEVVRKKQLGEALGHRGQIALELDQEILQGLRADGSAVLSELSEEEP